MVFVSINSLNDDPTLSFLPSDISVLENTASDLDLSAATFEDVDAGRNSVVLTIVTAQGTLTATTGGGVTIAGSGTGTLTLTGDDDDIDAYLNTPSNIQYTGPVSLTGNDATILTFTANDMGNTGSGGGGDINLGSVNLDILSRQTITFDPLPASTYGDADVTLGASASSGLAVSYISSNTSVATVSGSTVTITGAGSTTITASQAGDGTYGAATDVPQTLVVNKADLTATADDQSRAFGEANPAFTISYIGFKNGETSAVIDTEPVASTTATPTTDVGTAAITLLGGIDNNYTFALNNGTLTIINAQVTATLAISDDMLAIGETATVTITFSKAIVGGLTNNDLTIPNGTLSALSSSDGNVTFTGIYTPTAGVEDATNAIVLDNTGVPGTTINSGTSTTLSPNFAVDTKAPTGYSVSFDNTYIGALGAATTSFTISGGEVGATYQYSISSSGDGNMAITAGSGTITTATQQSGGVDASALPDGVLTISLSLVDAPGNEGSMVNDNSATLDQSDPIVTASQSFSLNEDASDNDIVGMVAATDNLSTVFSNWTITAGNADGVFDIDPSTGQLNILDNTNLDRESTATYTLTVTVNDQGGNTSAAQTVSIIVNDVNDVPPVVTPYQSFTISESAPNGTNVGTVLAIDADVTATTFSNWTITSGNNAGIFAINPASGELTIADNAGLDRETIASYTLTVIVEDGVNTSATQTLTIDIEDVNDIAPIITAGQSFAIDENLGNNASVGTVLATDGDVDPTTFSDWTLVAGNDQGVFAINPSTGEITIADNGNLDREINANFTLTLTVTDGVNPSIRETVFITVNDVNDLSPVITASQRFQVNENAENGTVLGTMVATDGDITITTFGNWTIVGGNDDNIFGIDATSGQLRVLDNTLLDFEANTSHILAITVSDGINTSLVENALIDVINDNEGPSISGLANLAFDEDTEGTLPFTVADSDTDLAHLAFSFHVHNNALFDVSGISVDGNHSDRILTLTPKADQFGVTLLDITITDGELSTTEQVTITVNAVNDAPSDLHLSHQTIAEDVAVGFKVGTLATTDADVDDAHVYSLVSGSGDTDNEVFTIAGDALLTNAELDFEDGEIRTIRLRATDPSGSFIEESFVITLEANPELELVIKTAFTPNGD